LTEKKFSECDSATFELRDDYFYVKYKNNSIVDLVEAKIQSEIILDLCQEKKLPFLIDFLNVNVRIDDESRQFFANDSPYIHLRKAQAIVVNNMQNKLLVNFYIKHHKPKNPIKLFDNLEDALDWIKSLPS
jgi:hypothetical protein